MTLRADGPTNALDGLKAKLYHFRWTCSLTVEAVLLVDAGPYETAGPAVFKENPRHKAFSFFGAVPALKNGADTLAEGAANKLWRLACRPETEKMPAPASPEKASAL